MSPSKSKRTTKSARQQRVESQLQRVLAELISRSVRDPRVGNVTITAVEAAPDMSVARIFFVPFVGGHSPDEVREGLLAASGFLRGEVGRRLSLRHAPRLEFEYDTVIERGSQLSALISAAVRADEVRKPDDVDPQ